MAHIDQKLQALVQADPDQARAVIITFKPGTARADVNAMGVEGLQFIEGLEGTCTASLKGSELLRLAACPEIEAIEADTEQTMLA